MKQMEYASNSSDINAIPETARQRRYDIDWLRTFALGILIIYHVVVSFQPWGYMIFFLQNRQPLPWLWNIMSMVNIWRIPLLFVISGMGLHFAMQRRNWKQLLKDRTLRILVPFIFGYFFICPISVSVALKYYGKGAAYVPNTGHLWFLANIYLYVLLLLPFLNYLKKHPDNSILRFFRGILSRPFCIFIMALPIMVEAWLVKPQSFPTYANTPHGFWLGMVCFFIGFIFISLKDVFWQAVEKIRRIAIGMALLLYLMRLFVFHFTGTPILLIAFESMCWMLAIFGYASQHLNKPSGSLTYLSKAVYPVYIIHMPVQYVISYYLLPLPLPALLKLFLLLAGTFGASLFLYEYVIRKLTWIRPLFGMKLKYD